MSTQPPPSAFDPRGSGDVAGLHAREVARLVAYLASSDRHCGAREAEDVAAEAFLEVAATWRGAGNASSVEVYLFACAHRIAVARSHLGRSGHGDALAESMPAFGEQSDLARLAVLQDALDQLPAAPRYAVLLREMCGFTPAQSAEIIGLPAASVELAREDALRTLVPVVESGTYAVHARRGPLSPDDFAALSRVLQHPDADRLAERRRVADRLAGGGRPAPSGLQFAQPSAPPAASGGWSSSSSWAGSGPAAHPGTQAAPSWSLEPGWSATTPLDAPLSQLDLSGTSTPIFDAISAWFATDDRSGESWEALEDSGWRAATARAASAPEVAGLSDAGLPKRLPGANSLPSAADVSRSMFGEPPRVDPGQVRHRLDSFQQGVNTARRLRGRSSEAPVDAAQERPWDPLFDPMPARRSVDGARPDGPGPRVEGPAPSAAPAPGPADGRDDTAFRAFHRDQLPHVLAALLLQGARPSDAAEVAQDAFDEAYWNWATLQSPPDWTRDRALRLFAERHDNRR